MNFQQAIVPSNDQLHQLYKVVLSRADPTQQRAHVPHQPTREDIPLDWVQSYLGPGLPLSPISGIQPMNAIKPDYLRNPQLEPRNKAKILSAEMTGVDVNGNRTYQVRTDNEEYQFTPRSYEYPPNVNTTISPRTAYGLMPFSSIQELSFNTPDVMLCAKLLKRMFSGLIPRVAHIDGDACDDPVYTHSILYPDGFNPLPTWLARWFYNGVIYDTPCLSMPRDKDGKIKGLVNVDGSSILPLIDENGNPPEPPAPAFLQIIWGTPYGFASTEQLWYRPNDLQIKSQYGTALVESANLPAILLYNIWRYETAYYTAGTMPEYVVKAPPGWTNDQISDWLIAKSEALAGHPELRAQFDVWPNGFEEMLHKDPAFREDVHKIAKREVMEHAGLPISEIGETQKSGLGGRGFMDAMSQAVFRQAFLPWMRVTSSPFNDMWATNRVKCQYGETFHELLWDFPPQSLDPTKEQKRWLDQFESGGITWGEFREAIGQNRFNDKRDELTYLSKGGVLINPDGTIYASTVVVQTTEDKPFANPMDSFKDPEGKAGGDKPGGQGGMDQGKPANTKPAPGADPAKPAGGGKKPVRVDAAERAAQEPVARAKPGGARQAAPKPRAVKKSLVCRQCHRSIPVETLRKSIPNGPLGGTPCPFCGTFAGWTHVADPELALAKSDDEPAALPAPPVTCAHCGFKMDYLALNETGMGYVACPQCSYSVQPDGTATDPAAVANILDEANGLSVTKAAEHDGVMIALAVPPKVAAKLRADVAMMVGGLTGVELEEEKQLHVTLAYLGTVDEAKASITREALQAAVNIFAHGHSPLKGEIGGLARFNPPGSVDHPLVALFDCPELPAFRQQLIEVLEAAGAEIDYAHGFVPHITLAYVNADLELKTSAIERIPLDFDEIVLAWGGEWKEAPLALAKHCGVCGPSGGDPGDDAYYGGPIIHTQTIEAPVQGANETEIVAVHPSGLPSRPFAWKPQGEENRILVDKLGHAQYVSEEACYLLDRALSFFMVPVSFVANVSGERGVAIHWVLNSGKLLHADDYAPGWVERAAVIDYISGQCDRTHDPHRGNANYLTHPDDPTRPILLDNGLSFPNPDSKLHIASDFVNAWGEKPLSPDTMASLEAVQVNKPLWVRLAHLVGEDAADKAHARLEELLREGKLPPTAANSFRTGDGKTSDEAS